MPNAVAPAADVPTGSKPLPVRSGEVGLGVGEALGGQLGCLDQVVAEAGPQVLAVTYGFDAPADGEPRPLSVRFTGERTGVQERLGPRDRFDRVEHLERVVPGSGRIALTARVSGVEPGTWRVAAAPMVTPGMASAKALLPRRVVSGRTRYGVLAQGPGVRLIAWPLLVCAGALVAILTQMVLSARAGLDVGTVLLLSLLGCAVGFLGAKVWYAVLRRKRLRDLLAIGACIQGFLLGALGVVIAGAALAGIPMGVLADVTAPGVFLGMAVGRPGCFLTGCCAGRPTGSRWGLWSSDRWLGIRRVPVQLIEAAVALLIGTVALALVLFVRRPVDGLVFVGSLAGYTFARQLLFPFRTESRTASGRMITMIACGVLLAGAVVFALVAR